MFPETPSQVLIRAEQECLASYRSIKKNKHKISVPPLKKNLAMSLDKRLYSLKKDNLETIKITTSGGRKPFGMRLYPKLRSLLEKYKFNDPKIFVRGGELWISLPFDTSIPQIGPRSVLGVDLGIRILAATSDGRLIKDAKFNKEKRRLRYLKRRLQSKGTKSATRHLKKLSRKERNKNKNESHLVANAILKTNADAIALENLKGIKAKKHKFQNKNRISQVPLYELRRIITYKADNLGKTVILVSPAWTSQIDSMSGIKEGERRGRRFYSKSGVVYDADINAAINIARRSKLPFSQGNLLDGQAKVNSPIVGGSHSQAPMPLG